MKTTRKRGRFFPIVELANTLEQEKAQGKTGQITNRLIHSDLMILDELGHLPFNILAGLLSSDREMVRPTGFEPVALRLGI